MKNLKFLLVGLLAWALFSPLGVPLTSAQAQSTALERGYRTGYSDGYNAGFKDNTDKANRDYQSKDDYVKAERSYNEAWGPIDDYRDGYQQGFEAGYAAGYEGQQFNSTIPTGLKRRPLPDAQTNVPIGGSQPAPQQETDQPVATSNGPGPTGSVLIPRDAVFLVEMTTSLSTDATQRGDRFQGRVLEPREFDGAVVEGRVTTVKRPGRTKGVAELQLAFDTIRLPDGRSGSFNADVIEVVQMGSSDGVGKVDPEGGVRGKDSTKDDVSKVGAATGIGVLIGAIIGGGKGAAIGGAIGAGAATGGVLRQRGKDIRLDQGQHLRVRTASETRIEGRN